MNCNIHTSTPAYNTCSKCGNWICDECGVELEGRIVCKSCISKTLSSPDFHGHDHHHPMPPSKPSKTMAKPPVEGRKIFNILLVLLFSAIPGGAQMYMGLLKRGLFFMISFFTAIFLTQTVFGPASFVPSFLIAIVFFTSFFDGILTRRKFIAGEVVSDNINDFKNLFYENKGIAIAFIGILVASSFFQSFRFLTHDRVPAFGIMILVLGILFLRKRRTCGSKKHDDYDKQ